MKKTHYLIITGLLALAWSQPALASDEDRKMHGHHMHGPMHGEHASGMHMQDMGEMSGMFMKTVEVDGFQVTFHVMRPEGAEREHFMVRIMTGGKRAEVQAVNSKVVHPDQTSEQKMMKPMGDWWMAEYDLSHDGSHQLMVLFKTADGKKHFTGIHYPEKQARP